MTRTSRRPLAAVIVALALALLAAPAPAQAFDPTKPICTLAGLLSTVAGKVCGTARHAGSVLKAGQKLLGGHLGGAVETLTGSGTPARAFKAAAVFAAASGWVVDGARIVLRETASVISTTTRPQLQSTWFSISYWRIAAISALLTLPFLFAAAIQAMIRSDLSLLLRSAFGYLPLGLLAVSIAAPVTQLLLAASDEMSALVSSASGYTAAGFAHVTALGVLSGGVSSFALFFVGLLAVAATMTLWIELLIRSAAVYVIVLMLPLFFSALVWPARRIWALRAIEVLVALILAKFAIVAVLSLGGAALGHTAVPSVTQMLAGTTLVMLAAFSPWALLRLLPLHELASGVEGLRGGAARGLAPVDAGAAQAYETASGFGDQLAAARSERPGADAARPSAARGVVEGLASEAGRGDSPRGDSAGGGGQPAAGHDVPGGGGQPAAGHDVPGGGGQPAAGHDVPGDAGQPPAGQAGPGGGDRPAAAPVEDGTAVPADLLGEVLGQAPRGEGEAWELGSVLGPHWEGGNLNGRILELGPEGPAEAPRPREPEPPAPAGAPEPPLPDPDGGTL